MIRTIYNQFDTTLYDLRAVKLLKESGFEDESWGNDSCPSLAKRGTGYEIQVLIETINPDSREFFGQSQYTAIVKTLYAIGCVDQEKTFESESIDDLINDVFEGIPDSGLFAN